MAEKRRAGQMSYGSECEDGGKLENVLLPWRTMHGIQGKPKSEFLGKSSDF